MNKQELSKIQVNNDGQMQMQQGQQQFLLAQQKQELDSKERIKEMEVNADIVKTREKIQAEKEMNLISNQTKMGVADTTAHSKEVSTDIAGQHQQVKAHIVNEKKEASLSN